MSDQLVGVIVGALIGFAGTALITLFQWRSEREKRREERLWQHRQEHIQRLRPAWERTRDFMIEYIKLNEIGHRLVSLISEVVITGELLDSMHREILAMDVGVSRLQELDGPPSLSDMLPLGLILDPNLQESVQKALYQFEKAREYIQDVVPLLRKEEPLGRGKAGEIAKRLAEDRQVCMQAIREVEIAMERYLTDSQTPYFSISAPSSSQM